MAENKTAPTAVDVDTFIDSVENIGRREDARVVLELFRRVTGEKPVMWGPSIIGFGSYHYKYASGREGDAPRSGFSPRKANMVIYLMAGYCDAKAKAEEQRLLGLLGPYKQGKSCLYLGRLDKIDLDVLERLVAHSLAEMDRLYPR